MTRPHVIERSYQLARSGQCLNVHDVVRQLSAEGYEAVADHLAGPAIRRELNALMKQPKVQG